MLRIMSSKIVQYWLLFVILALSGLSGSLSNHRHCDKYCARTSMRHRTEGKPCPRMKYSRRSDLSSGSEELPEEITIRNAVFKLIDGSYYHISPLRRLNWIGAVHRCHQLTAHLCSILDEGQFEALVDKLEKGRQYWIDTNNLENSRKYHSFCSGERSVYFNWHEGKPTSIEDANCVELKTLNQTIRMSNDNCNVFKFFICEL